MEKGKKGSKEKHTPESHQTLYRKVISLNLVCTRIFILSIFCRFSSWSSYLSRLCFVHTLIQVSSFVCVSFPIFYAIIFFQFFHLPVFVAAFVSQKSGRKEKSLKKIKGEGGGGTNKKNMLAWIRTHITQREACGLKPEPAKEKGLKKNKKREMKKKKKRSFSQTFSLALHSTTEFVDCWKTKNSVVEEKEERKGRKKEKRKKKKEKEKEESKKRRKKKKKKGKRIRKTKKNVSEVGFEPTPTYVDQNAQPADTAEGLNLESGALDRSAILTT